MYESEYYTADGANAVFTEGQKDTQDRRGGTLRSYNGRWDYIVCTLCVGCGKPLGRYENLNRLAYCRNCREILFPETIKHDEAGNKRFNSPRPESW